MTRTAVLIYLMLSCIFSESNTVHAMEATKNDTSPNPSIKLFLAGDVMTGRGIDQALPHSVDPRLHEPYIDHARDYLSLASKEDQALDTPVSYEYIWGDALEVLEQYDPDPLIINLETAITTSEHYQHGKGIHYRMHPKNVELLQTANIDIAGLANNHLLDWGREGLIETLESLSSAGLATTGAGLYQSSAKAPATRETSHGNIVVFAAGHSSSGIPPSWAATADRAGVHFLKDYSDRTIDHLKQLIDRKTEPEDIVIFSVHWGDNWGYRIPEAQRQFARRLIDEAGVDLVYGHSSHHPRGLEVYCGHLILYGTGDFINDYEGILGKEKFRDDLVLMYFPKLDAKNGSLESMELVPLCIEQFSLHRTTPQESEWMFKLLKRESTLDNCEITLSEQGTIRIDR